jgi:hypothetical protein
MIEIIADVLAVLLTTIGGVWLYFSQTARSSISLEITLAKRGQKLPGYGTNWSASPLALKARAREDLSVNERSNRRAKQVLIIGIVFGLIALAFLVR